MRKTLILIAVLIFSICFSACESVSAHSPPVEKRMVKYEKVSAVAVQTSVSSVTFARNQRAPAINFAREFALINPTVELSPTERSNQLSTVKPDENYRQGTNYDQPPRIFSGFGSDNNARAKI